MIVTLFPWYCAALFIPFIVTLVNINLHWKEEQLEEYSLTLMSNKEISAAAIWTLFRDCQMLIYPWLISGFVLFIIAAFFADEYNYYRVHQREFVVCSSISALSTFLMSFSVSISCWMIHPNSYGSFIRNFIKRGLGVYIFFVIVITLALSIYDYGGIDSVGGLLIHSTIMLVLLTLFYLWRTLAHAPAMQWARLQPDYTRRESWLYSLYCSKEQKASDFHHFKEWLSKSWKTLFLSQTLALAVILVIIFISTLFGYYSYSLSNIQLINIGEEIPAWISYSMIAAFVVGRYLRNAFNEKNLFIPPGGILPLTNRFILIILVLSFLILVFSNAFTFNQLISMDRLLILPANFFVALFFLLIYLFNTMLTISFRSPWLSAIFVLLPGFFLFVSQHIHADYSTIITILLILYISFIIMRGLDWGFQRMHKQGIELESRLLSNLSH